VDRGGGEPEAVGRGGVRGAGRSGRPVAVPAAVACKLTSVHRDPVKVAHPRWSAAPTPSRGGGEVKCEKRRKTRPAGPAVKRCRPGGVVEVIGYQVIRLSGPHTIPA
jgi:hypothetical protein